MKKIILAFVFSLLPFAVPLATVTAVDVFPKEVCNRSQGGSNNSAICTDKKAGQNNNPLVGPNGILTIIINLLSIIVAIVAIIGIILAGLKYITSGSNPQDVQNARERIIYAAVALAIAALAQGLVQLVLVRIVPD